MLFKKTKTTLTCYSHQGFVIKHFPIELAKKQVPESFSNMPLHMKMPASYTACPFSKLIHGRKGLTIRACDGILDLWSRSYVLTASFDVAINIKNNTIEAVTTDPNTFVVSQHPTEQFDGVFPGYGNVKIVLPWKLMANKSLPCMFTPAIYHMEPELRENLVIPQGVIDYKYVNSANINMLVKLQQDQNVIHIKAGTPLVYITPMTSDPVDIKMELVDKETFKGLENQTLSFKSIYKFLKRRDRKNNI